jgi:two-component system OmpR family sensor kinase
MRLLPSSLTGRLIVTTTIGVAAFWLAGALFSSLFLQHELTESFDRAEEQVAQRLLPLTTDSLFDRDEAAPEVHEVHRFEHGGERGLVYQLVAPGGRLVVKSDDAPLDLLDPGAAAGFSTTAEFRVFTLSDPSTHLTIQVGELLAHRQNAVWGSTLTLFLPLLLLIPLSAAVIWFATRRALRPLAALRREITARGSSNLQPLGLTDLPIELTPITRALDSLIGRLGQALEAERQFAANSAHELRTPIAGALAQTQRLLETTDDPRTAVEGRKIETSLRRLATLSEKLMQLARADAGMAATDEATEVLPVLRMVVSESGILLRSEKAINLRIAPGADGLRAPINVDALGIVLRNLIDNALAHSPASTPIEVELTTSSEVRVRNVSAVVPQEVLLRLRDRFQRGATSAPGSGLGLAIVDTILRQVGGELMLSSPIAGREDGFEAVARLPVVPANSALGG